MLSLSTFRSKVNPLFYQVGEDGYSCARCHATHNVLRIAENDPARGFDGEALMINYNSVLKVVNLGEPEASLLLRKPRSPLGQGSPDPSSPTGLTHVGGPRWESAENPSYRAILAWLREASAEAASESNVSQTRPSADGYAPGFEPGLAADGDLDTYWQTEFIGASPGYPHDLTLDLGSTRKVDGLLCTSPGKMPRKDGSRISSSASRSTAKPGRIPSPEGSGTTIPLINTWPCPGAKPDSSGSEGCLKSTACRR